MRSFASHWLRLTYLSLLMLATALPWQRCTVSFLYKSTPPKLEVSGPFNSINYINFIMTSIIASLLDYRMFGRTGEGTFSEVLRCQCLADSKFYACKKMKQRYDRCAFCYIAEFCTFVCSIDQVNKLREIQALRKLNPHPNIIGLKEVIL